MSEKRTARQIIEDNGYENVVIFENESYDSALIGISHDNRAIYSYDKMVEWYMEKITVLKKRRLTGSTTIQYEPFPTQEHLLR